LYNNAQGLKQIIFKTVWKERNMMASRSLGRYPSNKEEQEFTRLQSIAAGMYAIIDFARADSYKREVEILFSQ